jgi:hypothetical protein
MNKFRVALLLQCIRKKSYQQKISVTDKFIYIYIKLFFCKYNLFLNKIYYFIYFLILICIVWSVEK